MANTINPNEIIPTPANGLLKDLTWGVKKIVDADAAGGGGDKIIFDGEVTTVKKNEKDLVAMGMIDAVPSADSIKVTFNGIEYTCEKTSISDGYAYGGVSNKGPDFSQYPFAISNGILFTESAGTYSLKIEESGQSSSSTEFSTAAVTVHIPAFGHYTLTLPTVESGMLLSRELNIANIDQDHEYVVPLYKGRLILANISGVDSVKGSITIDGDDLIISGAGSIKMHKESSSN